MSSKDHHRLRLASPEPTRSDGNSSVRVNEATSNKDQSTASVSRRQTPEPLSLAGRRSLTPTHTPFLRNRVSMDDDLRGLVSRAGPQGVKRRWAELSDEADSDDEPTPKRDRLLEELYNLQAADPVEDDPVMARSTEQEEKLPGQFDPIHSLSRNQDLPLRPYKKADDAPSIEESNRLPEAQSTPNLSFNDGGTDERFKGSKARRPVQ